MATNTVASAEKNKITATYLRIVQIIPRLIDFLRNAVLQLRVYKKIYPGIMHSLIFWGVTIQVIGTAINLMQMALFIPFVELTFPRNSTYLLYELVMDMAGLAIILGVVMAAIRRFILRPAALETRWDDIYSLILLALIVLVGFTLEATRIISATPTWSGWSPIGNSIAKMLLGSGFRLEQAIFIHPFLFWTHAGLGLLFLASIPFTKLRHLIYSPLYILTRTDRNFNALEKIENIEEAETLGVGKINEFTSSQLLSLDACVRCGRCEEVCPATISGSHYSPRLFVQSLRNTMVSTLIHSNGKSEQELIGEYISEELPWACTTCGACLVKCPIFINPIDEVIDLRRYSVLSTGKLPKSVADALRNMERQGNPWGIPAENRAVWLEQLGVRELGPGEETDILLFMGCASTFDDRNKKVSEAFIRLLQQKNIDHAVLGMDESCCGETARRLGNEYLFQVFAEQNIKAFNKVKFNKIVTQCPHCYNTIKNEYPQLGGNYKILHYTEFLYDELSHNQNSVSNGKVQDKRYTYHDSCYLGRYNHIYSQPRQILNNADIDLVEISRHGEDSFCCGGGGGQMWIETEADQRINHLRLQEALDTNADVIATACPYCLLMFDDAIRSKGLTDQVQVMDIAEVLIKNSEK